MKPILITHPDASVRLAEWLLAHGWEEKVVLTESGQDYLEIKAHVKSLSQINTTQISNEAIAYYIALCENITQASLLHELQIISPVGTIEYEPEWIEKILSGDKTMSILKTQYPCGYHWLTTPDGEKRGVIQVTRVEKIPIGLWLDNVCRRINLMDYITKCGFDNYESLCAYHRENYSAIKYAHTFTLVKLEGDIQ